MATPARLAANRQNAVRSTGPRTPEGKASPARTPAPTASSRRQVLLPDENKARLIALREHFLAELAPVGELETLLVDYLVACASRLRRLHRVEAGVFQGERDNDIWGSLLAEHPATHLTVKVRRGLQAPCKQGRYPDE